MCFAPQCPHVAPRRRFLRSSAAVLGAPLLAPLGVFAQEKTPPKPENLITPAAALERLRAGNQRYVSASTIHHQQGAERAALVGGQNPFAAILGCADSRVVPEYAFDVGRGDLFVCRVAGNFANTDTLGSLEYSVAVLGVPLIVVLGHERCGAVSAALDTVSKNAVFPGSIQALADALRGAIEPKGTTAETLRFAIAQNVRQTMAALGKRSAIIARAQQSGALAIAGGVYHLGDGRVEFLA